MHPILADGGELTIMRDLAAFTYGTWDVEWPDSVPEENRPVIRDDRQHGYVYRMPKQVGRMGRRFVRADVTITAAEYTPQATPIAHSGASDVEHTLDEATKRTEGNVFLERAVTRAGLGMLVPYKDFDVDDVLPVDVWGKIIERPVTSIDVITERGAVIDWRVHFGDALVGDEASRGRANAEIFRTIAQERRERIREVGEVRQEAQAAQQELEVTIEEQGKALQSEIDETATGLEAVRSALHGEGSSQAEILSQMRRLQERLAGDPATQGQGLLGGYLHTNTALWDLQNEVNEAQQSINDQLQEADKQQWEMLQELEQRDRETKEMFSQMGSTRRVIVTKQRSSDPDVTLVPQGELEEDHWWAADVPVDPSTTILVIWYQDDGEGNVVPMRQRFLSDFREGVQRLTAVAHNDRLMAIDITRLPGEVKRIDVVDLTASTPRGEWVKAWDRVWVRGEETTDLSVRASVEWPGAWGWHRLELRKNNRVITTVPFEGRSTLFRKRVGLHSLSANNIAMAPGDTISLWVRSSGANHTHTAMFRNGKIHGSFTVKGEQEQDEEG